MLAPGYFGGSGAGIISEERAIAPFTPSIRLAQHTPDPERPSREVHTHSHAFREQFTRLGGADAACDRGTLVGPGGFVQARCPTSPGVFDRSCRTVT